MTQHKTKIIEQIKEGYKVLSPYKDLINVDLLVDFTVLQDTIESKVNDVVTENRVLRIGIVGEVKAGKSSFVNALLFKGKKVLPEAATPMTAALTKISYSDKLRAEVHFYTNNDWEAIEILNNLYVEEYERLRKEYIEQHGTTTANPFKKTTVKEQEESKRVVRESEVRRYVEERVGEQAKGAHELVEMVSERGLNPIDFFGKIQEIANIKKVNQLFEKLNAYVGAEGKYTPLVKSTNLYLDLPELNGLEVIDTPGTNDPILSRGLATKNYLSQCDVVFLLSASTQFMKAQDIEFMMDLLPKEGISRGIVVGSKIDLAILDDNKNTEFEKSYKITRQKLRKYAVQVVEQQLQKSTNHPVLLNLKEQMPEFVSSMMYMMAKKDPSEYDKNEIHLMKQFNTRYPEQTFDAAYLNKVSNIEQLKGKQFKAVIEDKTKIIDERVGQLLSGQHKFYTELIQNIQKDVQIKSDSLSQCDIKQLEERSKAIKQVMSKAESKLNYIFEKEAIEMAKKINSLILSLDKAQGNYTHIDVESKSESSSHSERHGFLNLKKRTITTTTTTYMASTQQVAQNIQQYTADISRNVIGHFDTLLDIATINKNVKQTIVEMIDLSDGSIEEENILNSIDLALSKLTLITPKIDRAKYQSMILDSFSSAMVTNNQIHDLRRKQDEVLNQIFKDIEKQMEIEKENIKINMLTKSKEFRQDLVKTMESNFEQVKAQISNKEKFVQKYNECLKQLGVLSNR